MENHNHYNPSSTTIPLPMDIITQILLHLPPKPLARFKCVSKTFLSLLTSSTFILNHIHHSLSTSTNLSLSVLNPTDHTLSLTTLEHSSPTTIKKLPLPLSLHVKHHDADIIGSCHGLLCVSDFPNFLSLVNPTTRTFQNIPIEGDTDDFGESHWVDFGFGFDQINKDYKVVRVDQRHGVDVDKPREVKVFSFKENSWKKVDEDFPHFLSHPKSHGKFVGNSLHWIASVNDPAIFSLTAVLWRGHKDDDFVYEYVIVVFDLNLEKFSLLPLPDYSGDVARLSLGVLGECLLVQVEYGPRFKRCLDIWVMKEYGVKESWLKLLSFPYQEVRGELLPVRTLALSKGGGEVLMQQGKDYFWFELGSGGIRDDVSLSGLPYQFILVCGHKYVFGAVVYEESLVSLSCKIGGVEIEQGGNDGVEGGDACSVAEEKKSNSQKKRGSLLSAGFKLK